MSPRLDAARSTRSAPPDTGQGEQHREAGGDDPTEDDDHHEKGDGQGDHLAARQVLLGLLAQLVVDHVLVADEDAGRLDRLQALYGGGPLPSIVASGARRKPTTMAEARPSSARRRSSPVP